MCIRDRIDGAWVLDESFTALESVTDETGAYAFSELPTTTANDDVTYLVGYAPRVEAIEEKWACLLYTSGLHRVGRRQRLLRVPLKAR